MNTKQPVGRFVQRAFALYDKVTIKRCAINKILRYFNAYMVWGFKFQRVHGMGIFVKNRQTFACFLFLQKRK